MPHSISPEYPVSPDQDPVAEEPKTDNVETLESEGPAVTNRNGPIRESQPSDDQDITMPDASAREERTPVKAEPISEVKLEDLFADIDSDEEFSSSTSQDVKVSSSPIAPASPV